MVADLARHKVFADKIQGRYLVPWHGYRLHYRERFVAVLYQAYLAFAVVDEIVRDGRGADGVVVDIHIRVGRIAANRQPSTYAAASAAQHQQYHKRKAQAALENDSATIRMVCQHDKNPMVEYKSSGEYSEIPDPTPGRLFYWVNDGCVRNFTR